MKFNFNRRKIELICTSLSFYLLLILLVLWISYKADDYFNWDIIPNNFQGFFERFLLSSVGGVILFSIIMSVILNISLVSTNLERIADVKEGILEKDKFEINKKTRRTFFLSVLGMTILLLSFSLWDKLKTSSRMNSMIENFVTTNNLSNLDKLIDKINYSDSVVYWLSDHSRIPTLQRESNALGNSNIAVYKDLQLKLISTSNKIIGENKAMSINPQLVIYIDNKWISTRTNERPFIMLQNEKEILNANVKDVPKFIFNNHMAGIKIINHEGYEVYYRAIDSRNFEALVKLKSKHPGFISVKFNYWE
jgi:hypothetical protein